MDNTRVNWLVFSLGAFLMASLAYFLSGWQGVKQALILVAAIPVGFGALIGGGMLFPFASEIEVKWKRLLAKTAGAALIGFALLLALAVYQPVGCLTPLCRNE